MSPLAQAAGSKDRPNIIFLMTDDQRWDNFGCYGKPEFKTLYIDRLADQSVIFDNAFYAVSICMLSRATMMNLANDPKAAKTLAKMCQKYDVFHCLWTFCVICRIIASDGDDERQFV
ncbi:MAG: sulfatase-like hydrolase/transferase [Planctomycetota bacterium]|jgi:hypothetical protein